MKKFIAQGVLLIIVIGVGIYFYSPTGGSRKLNIPFLPQPTKISTLQINDTTFKVEIADTPTKRNKGLGGKTGLGETEGMLFIFDNKDQHPFWMKGLLFSLDLVWISDNKIVDFTQNLIPPATGQSDSSLPIYSSKEPADKVLELNGGSVIKFNIKIGDTISLTQ